MHLLISRLPYSWLVLAAMLVGLNGCGRQATDTTGADQPKATEELSPQQVLKQLQQAYQSTHAYEDQAIVKLTVRRRGVLYEDTAPLAVRFERSGKLYLRFQQLELAIRDEIASARLIDANSDDFDGQVLRAKMPKELTPELVYGLDPMVSLAASQNRIGFAPQLDLLMGRDPLDAMLQTSTAVDQLPALKIGQHNCYRVTLNSELGRFVLWVDRASFLLRRLEYPVEAFAKDLLGGSEIDSIELSVDFRQGAFSIREPGQAFRLSLPESPKYVKQFVAPPQPLPSNLFGKRAGDFAFETLGAERVDSDSLKGKVAAMMWFNHHETCREAVRQLSEVYQKYRLDGRVSITAVCTEPSQVSNEQVQRWLRAWEVELPVVRDLSAHGRDVFNIPWAPALVVLDPSGHVQIFEVGSNPNLSRELPEVIAQVLEGTDVAAKVLAQHRQELAVYQATLQNGGIPVGTSTVSAEQAPRQAALQIRWETQGLVSPGNMLSLGDGRLVVLNGYRSVSELGAAGEVVRQEELSLPTGSAVSQLRTGQLDDGRRFYAVNSLRGPQVHLFNEQWEHLLSYPSSADQPESIQDVLLIGRGPANEPALIVGYWGQRGIECVDLRGQVLWSYPEAGEVAALGQTPSSRAEVEILAATAEGELLTLDRDGKLLARHASQYPIQQFARTDPTQTLGPGDSDPLAFVVMNLEGQLICQQARQDGRGWSYPLPTGTFAAPIQFVHQIRQPESGERWTVLVAPDSSIHLLDASGTRVDRFSLGLAINGMCVRQTSGGIELIVSSPKLVRGYQLRLPDRPLEAAQADPARQKSTDVR